VGAQIAVCPYCSVLVTALHLLHVRFKPLIVGLSILVAAGVTYSTAISSRSAAQIRELRSEVQKRDADNARLESEIHDLKSRLRALSERPEIKEKLVREDLGYVKKDELIFHFAEPAKQR
jgi:cell division protein FtsB